MRGRAESAPWPQLQALNDTALCSGRTVVSDNRQSYRVPREDPHATQLQRTVRAHQIQRQLEAGRANLKVHGQLQLEGRAERRRGCRRLAYSQALKQSERVYRCRAFF